MLTTSTLPVDGAVVIELHGGLEGGPAAQRLADDLAALGHGGAMVLDLSDVEGLRSWPVEHLLLLLDAGPRRSSTVVIHHDEAARRWLRARTQRLPVVPDLVSARTAHIPCLAEHPASAADSRPG